MSLLFLLAPNMEAQKLSWKKRVKIADDLSLQGNYYQAAEYYKSAYKEKPKELEMTFKAAECYFKARDYQNAVASYEPVRNENEKFDKPGYKYALCLKMLGEYDKAQSEFQKFGLSYHGNDYKAFEAVVKNEMEGCSLALEYQEKDIPDDPTLELLGTRINTDKPEFAPVPFKTDNGEVLYFSSYVDGSSKIYRAEKVGPDWKAPTQPDIFRKLDKPHYGNGSFTPDGSRFYFTECEIKPDGKPSCGIYLLEKDNGEFQEPVRLPSYINLENASTTHPFVTNIEDKEVLFFSSNREGGKGGMDIWFATKTKDVRGTNFTNPINLGTVINTVGDEVTPYYDLSEGVLYFSSNGLVNIGGFDVFKSSGDKTRWSQPVNLGLPINSSVDDLYYIPNESRDGGYLVSNRTFSPSRITTTDDDIFSFKFKEIVAELKGKVVDSQNPALGVVDVMVELYEIKDGASTLIKKRESGDGSFEFILGPKKVYRLIASCDKYHTDTLELNTEGLTESEDMVQNIPLRRYTEKELLEISPTPPIDPVTGLPFADNTTEFKRWSELANVAKRSRNGTIFYDKDGNIQPGNPIEETPPVADAPPAKPEKGKGKSKSKDKGSKTTKPEKTPPPPTGEPIEKKEEPVANAGEEPAKEEPAPTKKTEKKPKKEEPTEKTEEPVADNNAFVLAEGDDKVVEGITYKIQLAAVAEFKDKHFKKAAEVGTLEQEEYEGFIRVVMTGYKTIADARKDLKAIKKYHKDAFIIRYEKDARVGDGFQ